MCQQMYTANGNPRWEPCDRSREIREYCKPNQPVDYERHLSPSAARAEDYPPTPPRSTISTDSDRSSKRRSGSTIYVGSSKGSEISQISTSPSSHSYHMDSPPLSRSSGRNSIDEPRYDYERAERKTRRRGSSVEERETRPASSGRRPSVHVEIVNEPPSPRANTRARRHSRHSSRDSSDREELSQRRIKDLLLDEDERGRIALEAEIAKENDAINNRPSVPLVSPPSSSTSSSSKPKRQNKEKSTKERSTKERSTKESTMESTKDKYRRGSVAFNTPEDISRRMQSLQLQSQYQIEEEERRENSARAQDQRLRERFNGPRESSSREPREPRDTRTRDTRPPQTQVARPRRSSVAPSTTRRPTVSFDTRPTVAFDSRPPRSYDNSRSTVSYDSNSRPTVSFEDPYYSRGY